MNSYSALALAAGLVIFVAAYNFIRHFFWSGRLPEGGKMINIKGQDIFVSVKGTGSPAVVILTAAGSIACEWKKIQDVLSKNTTVIVYDRPGYGYSGRHKSKRNAENITNELKEILTQLKINSPFIIAGHSIGGLYAQYFCRKHPDLVKAAVFIDALSPDHREMDAVSKYMKYFSADGKMKKISAMMPMAAFGTLRLLKFYFAPMISFFYRNAAPDVKKAITETYLWPGIYLALDGEMKNIDSDIEEMKKLNAFPQIPLKIVFHNPGSDIKEMTAWKTPEEDAGAIEEKWQEIDSRFLGLSGKSEREESKKLCGHMVDLDDPDIIIKAVNNLIKGEL